MENYLSGEIKTNKQAKKTKISNVLDISYSYHKVCEILWTFRFLKTISHLTSHLQETIFKTQTTQ